MSLAHDVQFGGGMRSLDAIEQALNLGVSRVMLGTIAIEQPDVVARCVEKIWRGTNCCWN